MNRPPPWNDFEVGLLASLLDEVIPPSPDNRVPGAGALGVADFVVSACTSDPTLSFRVRDGLSRVATTAADLGGEFRDLEAAERTAVVKTLERNAPEAFQALLRTAYTGYYSRSDIRPLFGLSSRPTQPGGYDVPDDDPEEMAELLAPVLARGRCYRPS